MKDDIELSDFRNYIRRSTMKADESKNCFPTRRMWITLDFLTAYENLPARAKLIFKHLVSLRFTGEFSVDSTVLKGVVHSKYNSDISRCMTMMANVGLVEVVNRKGKRTFRFNDKMFGFFTVFE